MKKSDLKDGMVCRLRNGNTYIVLGNKIRSYDTFLELKEYNDNLTFSFDRDYDIAEVYTTDCCTLRNMLDVEIYCKSNLIWEREEPKEMTLEEIEKLLGYKVKIVEKVGVE